MRHFQRRENDFFNIGKKHTNENYYKYVAPFTEKEVAMLKKTILYSEQKWGFTGAESGPDIIIKLDFIINQVLRKKTPPMSEIDIILESSILGKIFGHAACKEYGWEWMKTGKKKRNSTSNIVSPQKNFSVNPQGYLSKVLKENLPIFTLFETMNNVDSMALGKKYYPLK